MDGRVARGHRFIVIGPKINLVKELYGTPFDGGPNKKLLEKMDPKNSPSYVPGKGDPVKEKKRMKKTKP